MKTRSRIRAPIPGSIRKSGANSPSDAPFSPVKQDFLVLMNKSIAQKDPKVTTNHKSLIPKVTATTTANSTTSAKDDQKISREAQSQILRRLEQQQKQRGKNKETASQDQRQLNSGDVSGKDSKETQDDTPGGIALDTPGGVALDTTNKTRVDPLLSPKAKRKLNMDREEDAHAPSAKMQKMDTQAGHSGGACSATSASVTTNKMVVTKIQTALRSRNPQDVEIALAFTAESHRKAELCQMGLPAILLEFLKKSSSIQSNVLVDITSALLALAREKDCQEQVDATMLAQALDNCLKANKMTTVLADLWILLIPLLKVDLSQVSPTLVSTIVTLVEKQCGPRNTDTATIAKLFRLCRMLLKSSREIPKLDEGGVQIFLRCIESYMDEILLVEEALRCLYFFTLDSQTSAVVIMEEGSKIVREAAKKHLTLLRVQQMSVQLLANLCKERVLTSGWKLSLM